MLLYVLFASSSWPKVLDGFRFHIFFPASSFFFFFISPPPPLSRCSVFSIFLNLVHSLMLPFFFKLYSWQRCQSITNFRLTTKASSTPRWKKPVNGRRALKNQKLINWINKNAGSWHFCEEPGLLKYQTGTYFQRADDLFHQFNWSAVFHSGLSPHTKRSLGTTTEHRRVAWMYHVQALCHFLPCKEIQ